MEGIVTAVKIAQNQTENLYTIVGTGISVIKSQLMLNPLDKVKLDGQGNVKITGSATMAEYNTLVNALIKKKSLDQPHRPRSTRARGLAPVSKNMTPRLHDAAKGFIRSIVAGSPVVVRFHNDCDGASGAIALYNAVEKLCKKLGIDGANLSWKMNRSVAYTTDGFHSDMAFFNSFSALEKPVVFISDFGTTNESDEALALCDGKCELIWLDHHPVYESFRGPGAGIYINPWNFGGDSDYTAGFLTSVFAELISGIDAKVLKEASLIGDYSKYANRKDERAHKMAIVLDYLTSKKESEGKVTPRQMKAVVEDDERLNEAFGRASSLLNEAIELGVNKANKYITKDDIRVYAVEFGDVIKGDDEYPLPGRYSSWLQNRFEGIEENGKVITLVVHGSYISVRATRDVAKRNNLLNMMGSLKASSAHILSFGGHGPAFSVKVEKGHTDHVVKLILHELGVS